MIEDTITCEDVLSEKICATLKEAAKKLKVKVEMVDKIVREAVAKGITKAKEIIKLVRQKIIDMATNLKCEDVLRADVSLKLMLFLKNDIFNQKYQLENWTQDLDGKKLILVSPFCGFLQWI